MNQSDESGPTLQEQSAATPDATGTLSGAPPAQSVGELVTTDGDPRTKTFMTGGEQTAPLITLPSIPGYELRRILGQGGMGVVYQARHLKLNRLVALKMLLAGKATDHQLARFKTEAEAVARFQHPNIVQIHEVGEHGGQPYFALEFVEGGSLDRLIKGTPQPPEEIAQLVATIALAMQAAHDKGVIHRDLKPANVLMAGTDEMPLRQRIPKVTDFGLAKQLDSDSGHTREGAAIGTPSYMAPEQAEGRVDDIGPGTDVWALGAILYELLTGRPPFKGMNVIETMGQVIALDPVPPTRLNPACPRDLELICLKCLTKPVAARYASARLLADDLGRWLRGEPISVRPAGPVERLVKWARRSPFRALATAVSAAFVLALLAALYGGMQSARQSARLNARDLDEGRRQVELRTNFTTLYSAAHRRTEGLKESELTAEEVVAWRATERDLKTALALTVGEPAFDGFDLVEDARRLLLRAEGKLADAQVRAGHRERLPRLMEHHADAVCYATLFVGLEQQDSRDRARRAVTDGLALFGVKAGDDGPPLADARFFSAEELRTITDLCYELLLVEADFLAQPQPGEQVATWRGRLREALTLLDRADKLRSGLRTYSGLSRRAEYLDTLGENDAAEQARLAATETRPTLAADHFLIGMRQHAEGDHIQASRSLAAALRLQPGHYGARYLLAVCRYQEGRYQESKVGLSACLDQRPAFVWPRLLRGAASVELGQDDEALEDFNAVLRDPPDTSAAYVALVNRAVLYLKRRRWDDAVIDLKDAIGRKPDAIPAHVNLALVYRQRAEVSAWQQHLFLLTEQGVYAVAAVEAIKRNGQHEAVVVLGEALRLQPKAWQLYRERARLHARLGQGNEALDDFTRAIALNPGVTALADDLTELGRLLHRQSRHAEAVLAYRASIKCKPDQAIAWRLQAEPLLALRRFQEAGAALDEYLRRVPLAPDRPLGTEQARGLADTFKARGIIHAEGKDQRAAIDSYTQGLKVVRDPEMLGLRGWAYLTHQAPALALADFDEALKGRPEDINALLGRADALVKLTRVDEALRAAEAALVRDPKGWRTNYNAARVYGQAATRLEEMRLPVTRIGEVQERAVELLRQALALQPAAERPAFWAEYVLKDGTLVSVRRTTAFTTLATERVGR